MSAAAIAVLLAALQAPAAPDQLASAPAHIGGIEVRGNHTTPDDTVLQLAGIKPGDAFDDRTPASIQDRLEKSGRFRSVEVLKRYQSLTDLSAVLIVIMVVEREGISIDDLEPGPWRRFRSQTMWLPILRFEDGYGFTYGARMSFVNVLGKRSRVSVPLSWGGERRASVEVERGFEHGPLTRVLATGGVWRRETALTLSRLR